jgi:hypothetical protein
MTKAGAMFWSGETLTERLPSLIEPFAPDRVDCAAYTLTVGPEVYVSPNDQTMLIGMLDMTRHEELASAACGQKWLRSIIEQKALTLLFLLLSARGKFFCSPQGSPGLAC